MTTTGPITRVVLTHLQIPFKEPFRISMGEVRQKDGILVAIETDSGVGLGESSPMAAGFGYSADTPEGCWEELRSIIAPSLLGRALSNTDEIERVAAGWNCSAFAIAGAETALWDLLGQTLHEPIADLLGGLDSRIDLGIESGLAVGLYPTIVELMKTIESHLGAGYRRVKIKIQPGSDLELVRSVRQHFGDIELWVDANGSYNSAQIGVFQELDQFDLLMFEQPMAAHDLDGLAALQQAVSTPVCLDETAATLDQTARAIDRGACRIVNLKIQRVGGLGRALAIYNLCCKHRIDCWVGSMPELGIGQAHGIHLATLGQCKYPSDLEPSSRWFADDCVVPAVEMATPGIISVPTRPGLGFHLDPTKVRRYRVNQEEFTQRTVA
jgi:O-succinylbenzoate synthase